MIGPRHASPMLERLRLALAPFLVFTVAKHSSVLGSRPAVSYAPHSSRSRGRYRLPRIGHCSCSRRTTNWGGGLQNDGFSTRLCDSGLARSSRDPAVQGGSPFSGCSIGTLRSTGPWRKLDSSGVRSRDRTYGSGCHLTPTIVGRRCWQCRKPLGLCCSSKGPSRRR